MKKGFRKWLSLLSAAVLAGSTVATSLVLTSAAAEEGEYTVPAKSYIEYTSKDAEKAPAAGAPDAAFDSVSGENVVLLNAGGTLTYAVPLTAQLRVTATSWANQESGFTFEVSADNRIWSALDMKAVTGAGENNAIFGGTTYSGTSETPFRFVRITLPEGGFVPGVCNLYVKPLSKAQTSYKYALAPNADEVLKDSEGTLSQSAEIGGEYLFLTDAGAGTEGSFTFVAKKDHAITSFHARGSEGFGGSLKFSYSKDGKNFVPFVPVQVLNWSAPGAWRTSYDYYDSFEPADGISYIRITLKDVGFHLQPCVGIFEYNSHSPADDCTYKIDGTKYYEYTAGEEGKEPAPGAGDVNFDGTTGMSLIAAKGGTLTYVVPSARQLKVTGTAWKGSGDTPAIPFEVSADNQNWTPLSMTAEASDFGNPNFIGQIYYGESDVPFRYVKATFTENSYAPSVCNLYVLPLSAPQDAYEYSIAPNQDEVLKDSEGVLMQNPEITGEYLFFAKGGDTTSGGVSGSLTFVSRKNRAITSFHVRGSEGYGGSLEFAYSKDGKDFVPFIPARVSNWTDGPWRRGYDYYDSFKPADGISQIRITLKDVTFNRQPCVGTFEYNSHLSDSEFEQDYANNLPANDAGVTADGKNGAVLKETDALASVVPNTTFYAFGKDTTTGEGKDAVTTTAGRGGTLIFKGDKKNFTDVCLKIAVGPEDTLTFYKSADTLFADNFKIASEQIAVRKIADLPGGGSVNYYSFSIPQTEEIRYIRVDMAKKAGDETFGLPAASCALYNGIGVIDYAYRIGAGNYYEVSTEDKASFKENQGVFHFNKDGSSVDGSVTYKSDYPLRQFNFRILKSDSPGWAGDFTYWVSATGAADSWVQILPGDAQNPDGNPTYTVQQVSKHPNGGWDSSYCNVFGDLDAGQAYQYLQIRADVINATSFPLGPQYVQFNVEGAPSSYAYTVNPSQAQEIAGEDGGVLTNFEGGVYLFHKKADNGSTVDTAGTLTFTSPYPFKDFNFRVVMPDSMQCDPGISFEAYTADGTRVDNFKPMISRDYRHNTGWGSAWFNVCGSLAESDNVRRITVRFAGGGTWVMPAIKEFQYNLPAQPSYTEKQTPKQNVSAESGGKLVTGVAEIPDLYLFHDDSGKAVPGKLVFRSELPVTDYSFSVLEGADKYGGNITYSASADGKTWTPIEDYVSLVTGIKSPSWGPGQFKNVYGTFKPEDDIHYLRVELNNNGVFAKQPALNYIEYNVDGVIRPQIYRFQQGPEEAKTESSGRLTPVAAGSEYFHFEKDGAAVAGSLVFEAENFITDLTIRMQDSRTRAAGSARFYYSADGKDWIAFDPYATEDGGEYYDKFPNGKVARFIRVDLEPGADGLPGIASITFNTGTRYYEQLADTPDISDLNLPQQVSDFASGDYGKSIFRLSGMTITNNGSNNEFIGGNFGMVQNMQDGSIMLYTPGMKDFKFTSSYGGGVENVQYKAYGRKTQNGEETEIPLMRTKVGQPGFEHSQYRPADREGMDDYLYLRIVGKIEFANMVQLLNVSFFYEGDEPGDVPAEEGGGGAGTDRTNVKTYNFIKGNMNPLRSENMVATENAIGNIEYIGTKQCLITETDGLESFVTFRADGITKFYVKVHMVPEYVGKLPVKILVAPVDDDSQYVEIPLQYALTKDQPTGWVAVEYMPADGAVIPEGSCYIKYLLEEGDHSSQLVRIDYEYEEKNGDALADWAAPDTGKGEKEMLDRFDNPGGLLEEQGGKAYDLFQVSARDIVLVAGQPAVRVVCKDSQFSDGFLVYRFDEDIHSFDVRGYRAAGTDLIPILLVSEDGENWEPLEGGRLTTRAIFDGPEEFSLSMDGVPAGMKYLRVEIPDLEGTLYDMLLSGVQVLYGGSGGNGGYGGGDDVPSTDTGVVLPLAAGVTAALAGTTLAVSRKRRSKAKECGKTSA